MNKEDHIQEHKVDVFIIDKMEYLEHKLNINHDDLQTYFNSKELIPPRIFIGEVPVAHLLCDQVNTHIRISSKYIEEIKKCQRLSYVEKKNTFILLKAS